MQSASILLKFLLRLGQGLNLTSRYANGVYNKPIKPPVFRYSLTLVYLSRYVTELVMKTAKGWFKLLGQQEGEFYNVPIVEDEEAAALSAELEVDESNFNCFPLLTVWIYIFYDVIF